MFIGKEKTGKILALATSLLMIISIFCCGDFSYAIEDNDSNGIETTQEQKPVDESVVKETEIKTDNPKSNAVKRSGTEHNDVITELEILLEDGSGPVGDVEQWQVFRLNAEFLLPNGQVNEGDITTIKLPEKLKFNQTAGFEILSNDGGLVANAVIDGNSKTITITYTDYAENHSNVSGSFFVYLQIDRNKVDEEETIPLFFDVSGNAIFGGDIHFVGITEPTASAIAKSGWQWKSDDKRTITFSIIINTEQKAIKNASIDDDMQSEGITIQRDSLTVLKGSWAAVHGDWELQNSQNITSQCDISWKENDAGFIINFGDIDSDEGIRIRYQAVSSYDLADGEKVINRVSLTGENIVGSNTTQGSATYYEAGGLAVGYAYKIQIRKENKSGDALSGAVFDVVRNSNGATVGTITTDASGEGSIDGLLLDQYTLIEREAPFGYKTLDEPVIIDESDFDSEHIAFRTIENELETVSVPVEKKWVGSPADRVIIYLLADGEKIDEVELTDNSGWFHTFSNLPKYDLTDGHEIEYTVDEDPLTGYTCQIEGNSDGGFIITNTSNTTTTTDPKDPTDPSNTPGTSGDPKTGDSINIYGLLAAMLAAALAIVLLLRRRSKEVQR